MKNMKELNRQIERLEARKKANWNLSGSGSQTNPEHKIAQAIDIGMVAGKFLAGILASSGTKSLLSGKGLKRLSWAALLLLIIAALKRKS